MTMLLPFSAACERNKDPILEALSDVLEEVDAVLEIGSGTAQHALHFARAHPHLEWQTSDREEYLDGIKAQLDNAKVANVHQPWRLDVTDSEWCVNQQRFPLVYTANTLHIMPWSAVELFFSGLDSVVSEKAYLAIYGPFKLKGQFSSESNRQFDANLRARGVGSGLRELDAVIKLARGAHFSLRQNIPMPANNQCLIFRRQS